MLIHCKYNEFMRYTVTFNQLGLLHYNDQNPSKKIDFIDAILLMTLYELSKWDDVNKKIHNNQEYFWAAYQKILDEIPTLPLHSKDSISKRFKKLISYGLIKRWIDKKDNSKTYFRLTAIGLESVTYRMEIRQPIGWKSGSLSDGNPTNNNTINKKTKNKRESSHYDFLINKFPDKVKELHTKYFLDAEQKRLCIGGYNEKDLKSVTLNSFERYLSNWKNNLKEPKRFNNEINYATLRRVN